MTTSKRRIAVASAINGSKSPSKIPHHFSHGVGTSERPKSMTAEDELTLVAVDKNNNNSTTSSSTSSSFHGQRTAIHENNNNNYHDDNKMSSTLWWTSIYATSIGFAHRAGIRKKKERIGIMTMILVLFILFVLSYLHRGDSSGSKIVGRRIRPSIVTGMWRNTGNDENEDSSVVFLSWRKRPFKTPVPSLYRKMFHTPNQKVIPMHVQRAFTSQNWERTFENTTAHFVWMFDGKYASQLKPWQRSNRLPFADNRWDNKAWMMQLVTEYERKTQQPQEYIPETYRLYNINDRRKFVDRLERDNGQALQQEAWVLKTSGQVLGRGVTMLGPNSTLLRSLYHNVSTDLRVTSTQYNIHIVQKYLCNALTTLDGHKFDLRVYWLVASYDPLIVYYHDGLVRVGITRFNETTWENTKSHLTVVANLLKVDTAQNFQYLEELLFSQSESSKKNTKKNQEPNLYQHVRNQIKAAMAQFVHVIKDATLRIPPDIKMENSFMLSGADFVIDQLFNVWMLEAQKGPALVEYDNPVRANLLDTMLSEVVGLVELITDRMEARTDNWEDMMMNQDSSADRSASNTFEIPKRYGGWELIYAEDGHRRVQVKEEYSLSRPRDAVACGPEN